MVVAARDKEMKDKERNLVAIKKIDKAFEHKIFTKRTLRELRLLKLLKHENVPFSLFRLLGWILFYYQSQDRTSRKCIILDYAVMSCLN